MFPRILFHASRCSAAARVHYQLCQRSDRRPGLMRCRIDFGAIARQIMSIAIMASLDVHIPPLRQQMCSSYASHGTIQHISDKGYTLPLTNKVLRTPILTGERPVSSERTMTMVCARRAQRLNHARSHTSSPDVKSPLKRSAGQVHPHFSPMLGETIKNGVPPRRSTLSTRLCARSDH